MARSQHTVGLTRTTILLPDAVIESLKQLGSTQSDRVRMALERYIYIRSSALSWTEHVVEEFGDLLKSALADYDETDYKTIARVLPELVENHLSELSMYDPSTQNSSSAVAALKDLNVPARMAVLDWVVAERARETE